jgi:hypothetical protein
VDGAGAAEAAPAAELGADEIEVVAEDPEQRRVGIGIDLHRAVIDGQRNHGHAVYYAAAASFVADPNPMFCRC